MVVFSNRHLGPSAELFVSDDVGRTMLSEAAAAARPVAEARWEVELVLWLDSRAGVGSQILDVAEIAWTPEHFEAQRAFVVQAIQHAARCGEHVLAFDRWRRLVEAHPADRVQLRQRWVWPNGTQQPASQTSG
jgi:hypothetical protein